MPQGTSEPQLSPFQMARALQAQGQLAQAKAAYEDIVKQDTGHFEALHMLGIRACYELTTAFARPGSAAPGDRGWGSGGRPPGSTECGLQRGYHKGPGQPGGLVHAKGSATYRRNRRAHGLRAPHR